MSVNVATRTIGINFDEQGWAHIKVWAPLAQQMAIHLPEKNQTYDLDKDAYGYWLLHTERIEPGDRYWYIINGKEKRPDPASIYQPEGVHGVSQALDITKTFWTDENWSNLPLEDYIIYELHVGTFSTAGDLAGVAQRLDYLKELGVTAIELMPLAQFPGNRNWGYDGVFPFAVHNTYGGPTALQQFVNMCHEKGLCVILDVVYNHLGPEGNYLGDYGPYFTNKYQTPWGAAINFDDSWCDGVRNYFIENALMWFRDFHIDALRLDAVHAIKDLSPKHILREIKEAVNTLMEATNRKHYLIIECDLNDSKYIDPLSKNGFGMDAQWIDEFHHSLRVTAGNERNGYYADFEGIAHLAKAYKDAYVYDGMYSFHRNRTFGTKATDNPGKQFIVFSQNHDQVGNRMLGERTSNLVSFEMQKLLAGAIMISPYIPLLFMGEEYSESNPFLYFVSHTDPELVAAVKKGRKAEFASFHTSQEVPDPQSVTTFEHSRLQWELHESGTHKTMLDYYKALINLRKQNKVLNSLDRLNLTVTYDEQQKLLLLSRWQDEEEILSVLNFSEKAVQVTIPAHKEQWYKIFDSADTIWLGKQGAPAKVWGGNHISSASQSIQIYSNKNV